MERGRSPADTHCVLEMAGEEMVGLHTDGCRIHSCTDHMVRCDAGDHIHHRHSRGRLRSGHQLGAWVCWEVVRSGLAARSSHAEAESGGGTREVESSHGGDTHRSSPEGLEDSSRDVGSASDSVPHEDAHLVATDG